MKYFGLMALLGLFFVSACDNEPKEPQVAVVDMYAFETPQMNAVAGLFGTIVNTGNADDALVTLSINGSERTELHTMQMDGDIMRMRAVQSLDIPADGELVLDQNGNHGMVYGRNSDWTTSTTVSGMAIFEKSGGIPFTVNVLAQGTPVPGANTESLSE